MHKLLTDKIISKWFISLCELCMFCISVGVALCYMLNLDTISPNDWDSVQFYIINLIKTEYLLIILIFILIKKI